MARPYTVTQGRRNARILVLDADMVPALTIARSLARRSYRVDVASSNPRPIAGFSNCIAARHRYPDPLSDEPAFLHWLQVHQAATGYDLIIPVTERSLVPLHRNRAAFLQTNIAMASAESLAQALDKAATFRLAEALDVSVPRSLYLTDTAQLDSHAASLSYPVVIKPSQSVSEGDQGYRKHTVSYATSPENLYAQCERALQHSPVILQSYFQGLGTGIELIAKNGRVLYAFQHVRVHELPLSGGGSSFRKSTEIAPELLDASERLMEATRWTGVAMVEFKWHPQSKRYCLMEINGRFWGSLPLADAAGADFPAMLAELLLTGTLAPYPDYRREVYCRHLSKDLAWLELVLRSRSDEVTPVPTLRAVLKDALKVFSPRHHFDTQNLSDPVPGLVEIQRTLIAYTGRILDLASETWFTIRQRMLWYNGTVRESLENANSVLFVCYGNINRSALAGVLLTTMRPDLGAQVRSAGFHREEGRPADARMQGIARESGYDLDQSRSSCITEEMIDASDSIFVVEKAHYDRLLSMRPSCSQKIFLLGAHRGGEGEIADPYNQTERAYRKCFGQIQAAISVLATGRDTLSPDNSNSTQ